MYSYPKMSSLKVRASMDTQQRLLDNPNSRRNPNKNPPNTFSPPPPSTATTARSSITITSTPHSVSQLRKRNYPTSEEVVEKLGELYLGCERWLPIPPKVEKPRSLYNATTLAYLGDSIYELYARRHFVFPPLSIEECNDRVMTIVRCEAQDALLQKLLNENFLSDEERKVLRWGKNIGSVKTRTKRRAGAAVYNRASSLETLIGYLYLTNVSRLEEVMQKLGFTRDSSTETILEGADDKSSTI